MKSGMSHLPYRPEVIRKKVYFSELVVGCVKPLDALNPGLSRIASKLSSMLEVENLSPYSTFGISFANDPAVPIPLAQSDTPRRAGGLMSGAASKAVARVVRSSR